MSDPYSVLDDPGTRISIFAVLVKRLGGQAIITQADFDEVAYDRLVEDYEPGKLTLIHKPRPAAS